MIPHKILIIDDQISFLNTIVDILEKESAGYEIYQTINPLNAIKIAENKIPDLIITDWEMPQMTGIDLIKSFKASAIFKDIPIIMCSGVMTSSVNLKMAIDAGAVDFIRKPIDELELVARVQSMLKLSDSYHEIKKLVKYRDLIFSVIAHDLRGSIGNSKTALEFIFSEFSKNFEEKTRLFFDLARKSISSSFWLLENLLDWAKAQQNIIKPKILKYNLCETVETVFKTLEPISIDKKIKLSFISDAPFYANFDIDLITTVLRNLVGNALKFSYKDSIIEVKISQNEQETTLQVLDNGIGISEQNIKKIFNNNDNFTTWGTNNEKGSGLGLNLCKNFIEMHNGRIWIENRHGGGSCFSFSLPNTLKINPKI